MQYGLLKIATCMLTAVWTQAAGAQTVTPDRDLLITNAWTRPSLDIGGSAEVYFTLSNTGAKTLDLIGVRTGRASIETLHKTTGSGETERMSAVAELRVKPGASVTFEPRGMHVMLIDVEKPLVEGNTLPLRLTFYDGDDLTVEVPILGVDATGPQETARAPKTPSE